MMHSGLFPLRFLEWGSLSKLQFDCDAKLPPNCDYSKLCFHVLTSRQPASHPSALLSFLCVIQNIAEYICPQTKIHTVHAAYIGLERSYLYIKIHNIPPLARLSAMPAATHNDAVFSDLMRLIRM